MKIFALAALALLTVASAASAAQAPPPPVYGFADYFTGSTLNARWAVGTTGPNGTGDPAFMPVVNNGSMTYTAAAGTTWTSYPINQGNAGGANQNLVMGTALPTLPSTDFTATIKMAYPLTYDNIGAWQARQEGICLYSNDGKSFMALNYLGSQHDTDSAFGPNYDTGVNVFLASPSVAGTEDEPNGVNWPNAIPLQNNPDYTNSYHADFGSAPFELRIQKTATQYALSYSTDNFKTSTPVLNPAAGSNGIWTYSGTGADALANVGIFSSEPFAGNLIPKTFYSFVVSPVPGDCNGDGLVDDNDLGTLLSHWGNGTTWAEGDFNGDGTVDDNDLGTLLSNWTGTVSGAVPEPVTMSLLAVGALALLRRRMR